MKGILLTMLSAIAFGFAFTLGPMTYGDGGSNPTTLTFLRNALSLPVLFLILRYQGISLKVTGKELISLTILGGIGNAFTTLLLFISFSLIDVGIATTIHFIYPVFVTIGCVLFFKERLGIKKNRLPAGAHLWHSLLLPGSGHVAGTAGRHVPRPRPGGHLRCDLCLLHHLP